MNKLHTVLLMTVLCSIVQGLTASQEQRKAFFNAQTIIDRCKMITQRVTPIYAGMFLGGMLHNGYKYYITPPLNLVNPGYYKPNVYSSNKSKNFFKANLRLLQGLGITFPFACAAVLAWDKHQQSISQK